MPTVSWPQQARRLANTFINFVLPPVCAHCQKAGSLICTDCAAGIEWIQEPICHRCGQPDLEQSPFVTGTICLPCSQRPFLLHQIRAATRFTGPIPPLIHKLKYSNAFALASPLAELMVHAWDKWRMPAELIIPVPLHQAREKARGYNQSERLARPFSAAVGCPLEIGALQRVRQTAPQVNLDAGQRQRNVRHAFSAPDPALIRGRHILLIDDVCTTGATLRAAAEALISAGATAVSAYCLARAV